jgi:hypothetical protein
MLASEAISRIQRKLGYRSDKADEILDELKDAQLTLEMGVPTPGGKGGTFFPWFLTSEVATATVVVNEPRLLLPSTFTGDLENHKLYYFDSSAEDDEQWNILEKGDYEFLLSKYPGKGTPKAYAYSGDYWRIFPVPDGTYPLKVIFAEKDSILDTVGVENRWLKYCPWLLISAAGANIAASVRDSNALQFFQARFAVEQVAVHAATIARSDTNQRPVMGGEY